MSTNHYAYSFDAIERSFSTCARNESATYQTRHRQRSALTLLILFREPFAQVSLAPPLRFVVYKLQAVGSDLILCCSNVHQTQPNRSPRARCGPWAEFLS